MTVCEGTRVEIRKNTGQVCGRSGKRGRGGLARRAPGLTSVTALALLTGLAVNPGALTPGQDDRTENVSQDWYETTAAEQLREDQCLMNGVLQLGGPSMAAVAQDALNQPTGPVTRAGRPRLLGRDTAQSGARRGQGGRRQGE